MAVSEEMLRGKKTREIAVWTLDIG